MADKKKKECPIKKKDFLSGAQALTVEVAGQTFTLNPRPFSTGSVGYNANGKVSVVVDGKVVPLQLNLNLTVIGSKEAKE